MNRVYVARNAAPGAFGPGDSGRGNKRSSHGMPAGSCDSVNWDPGRMVVGMADQFEKRLAELAAWVTEMGSNCPISLLQRDNGASVT